MNRARALLAVVTLAALAAQSGCIVRSVHPWFAQRDIVFESDLLGGWVGKDGGKDVAMTFVRGEGNAYFVQYQSGDTRGSFRALLGKVGSEYYLDFRPIENPPGVDGLLLFPTHCVARLDIGTDKLSVRVINYDAFTARARADKFKDIEYAWDEENEVLVHSKTDDLRHFLIATSRDTELFAEPLRLTRGK